MVVIAHQQETLDALCYRVYRRTAGITEAALEANPGLAEYGPTLPPGYPVVLPDLPAAPLISLIQLWE